RTRPPAIRSSGRASTALSPRRRRCVSGAVSVTPPDRNARHERRLCEQSREGDRGDDADAEQRDLEAPLRDERGRAALRERLVRERSGRQQDGGDAEEPDEQEAEPLRRLREVLREDVA